MSIRKYSKISSLCKKPSKQLIKFMGKKSFADHLSRPWNKVVRQMAFNLEGEGCDPLSAQFRAISSAGEAYTIGNNLYHNVFIDSDDIFSFLKSTRISYCDSNALLSAMGILSNRFGKASFALHSKTEKHSTIFNFVDAGKSSILSYSKNGLSGFIAFHKDFKDDGRNSKILAKINESDRFRIVVNLAAYLECFPDKIKSGPPNELKQEYGLQGSTRLISNPKISEDQEACARSAHLRRGHMRLLTHERYGENVGKWVYVRPTMVKGTAETVMH